MAILIDQALWPWRDWLWCHMISDTSVVELKEFAQLLGVPEKGFQGDHVDLPEHMREVAIANGAIEVSSRELVEALYRSGLRLRPSERDGRPAGTAKHQP
ncbi:MAG: DUF4031 domain-containing protein [Actinomycetales bacterium]|nr:DUF4031 domain-containing protein [Actinomycetales bacterium]